MATHIKNLITERQKLFHNIKCNKNDDNKKWKKRANIIRHQIRKRKEVTKTASKIEIITPDMVIKELKKLDVTKAPGPDNINNKILKDARFGM
jgi:hypothetical protein